MRILTGDCRKVLPTLESGSVHCCVSSPPYLGLRDYGMVDQIGMEATPEAFVAELVSVFREVRRVLRDDGTLWLNLGDSYAGSGRGGNSTPESSTLQGSLTSQEASRVKRGRDEIGATARQAAVTKRGSRLPAGYHERVGVGRSIDRAWVPPPAGLKQKDLIGIPWMVAFALRADGWFLRQDIIWSKPNPMPESVQDRCTKAHEYIFMLSKSARYYYDAAAIAEDAIYSGLANQDESGFKDPRSFNGKHKNGFRSSDKQSEVGRAHYVGFNDRWDSAKARSGKRNKRSVWSVPTAPFADAHFATFPPDLIEPCIKAGCPIGGTVLDPFGGAGTTGLVADRLRRSSIMIELNPQYAAMAERRILSDAPLFNPT